MCIKSQQFGRKCHKKDLAALSLAPVWGTLHECEWNPLWPPCIVSTPPTVGRRNTVSFFGSYDSTVYTRHWSICRLHSCTSATGLSSLAPKHDCYEISSYYICQIVHTLNSWEVSNVLWWFISVINLRDPKQSQKSLNNRHSPIQLCQYIMKIYTKKKP